MITWTDSAKHRLDDYLEALRRSLQAAGTGADPVEVTEDIRRHISEEARATQIEVMTSDDVDRLLRRIGAPETAGNGSRRNSGPGAGSPRPSQPVLPPVAPGLSEVASGPLSLSSPPSSPSPRPAEAGPKRWYAGLLFFGVILPAATLLIELVTHMCAATFFDPIPTWWHVAMVGLLPIANFVIWRRVRDRDLTGVKVLGIVNAFVIGVASYYALLYLPLAPYGLVGILFVGFGLLPLAPLFSVAATWRLRLLLRRTAMESGASNVPGLWSGLGAAVAALALLTLPMVLTRHWSTQYVHGDAEQRRTALSWLRSWGHERTMRSDCYGTRQTGWDELGLVEISRPVSATEARNIYYLSTGRAFNSVAPPQAAFRGQNWEGMDDRSWDGEQGGTIVGGRLKGLGLAHSRLDGLLDADAGWSYVEWTLEFKNVATLQREARAQIALPPGGVVSRLTLWVNGEEREAAFAGSGQVRSAYQQVVNVQRRDPVLVTSCGPDRVLMQCFPVPPNGGTIKVRLGITAPLHLEKADQAVVRYPWFLEKNFTIADDVRHSVWLEGPQVLTSSHGQFIQDRSKPGVQAIHGELRDADLGSPSSLVHVQRDPSIQSAWVEDPRDDQGRVVRQMVRPLPGTTPRRLILVVDGSKAMKEFTPGLAAAIRCLPEGMGFSLLLARDGVEELARTEKGGRTLYEQAAAELLKRSGVGGQDNVPALARAWDLASETSGPSAILWVHQGQPQLFETGEMLKQRLDWRAEIASSGGPLFYELQIAPGPDRVLEKNGNNMVLHSVPRFGTVQEDVERLAASWRPDSKRLGLVRDRHPAAELPLAERGKRGSRHLARLWAFDEVLRLVRSNQRDLAVETAAKYQLVTPVSGAVVLENKQQFVQAGLQPVDPNTVPNVPEPGTILLLVLAGGVLVGVRWWRRRNRTFSRAS